MNIILWVVGLVKDAVWEYQFKRTKTVRLHGTPAKYFRGSWYIVNEDGTR